MHPRSLASRVFALTAIGLVACSFDIPGILLPDSDGGDDLSAVDAAGDLLMVDLATSDLAGLCTPSGPSSGCADDGLTLLTCVGTTPTPVACDVACSNEGSAHCTRLDPGGVAEPGDYESSSTDDLADVTLSGTVTFNTDTGAISATSFDRAGGVGIAEGIRFREAAQANGVPVGVFGFRSLTFAPGSTVRVVGMKPLSLVAQGDITVGGTIDVQGPCTAGLRIAGGGLGGAAQLGAGNPGGGTGAGLGGGVSLTGGGGGGGGGYGDIGGAGAVGDGTASAGAAGPLFGDLTATNPLLIGGGGGGAGGGGVASMGGAGGAGGGALQLASNGTVILAATAIIQAGGCGGSVSTNGLGGGGGGGAGGMILIEGRLVQIASGAILVANGGGGAGGGDGSDGEGGQAGTNDADGGDGGDGATTRGSKGGDGGHSGELFGAAGEVIGGSEVYGGGGGGGVGRIALKSRNGSVGLSGVTMSPQIDELTPGRAAPARLGTVGFR